MSSIRVDRCFRLSGML
uniref:Uncharacterized protein n=1 Tax=Anguilla anguilla TaxID=7936 RepID=A0A0E9TIN3_ANGAN